MYLRSVRSPYGSKGPYKLAYNVGQDIDVYSQVSYPQLNVRSRVRFEFSLTVLRRSAHR